LEVIVGQTCPIPTALIEVHTGIDARQDVDLGFYLKQYSKSKAAVAAELTVFLEDSDLFLC